MATLQELQQALANARAAEAAGKSGAAAAAQRLQSAIDAAQQSGTGSFDETAPPEQQGGGGFFSKLANIIKDPGAAYMRGQQQQQQFFKDLPENYAEGNRQLNYEGALADKARVFANDLTFNAFDPVVGTFTGDIEGQRKATEAARERLPAGFEIGSGVLGGLASGGALAKGGLTAAKFAPQARTLGSGAVRAGINATEQAALSGLAAYNRGDDWKDIGKEALIGGAVTLPASAAGGVKGRINARREAAKQVPPGSPKTMEEAFEQAGTKYRNVDAAGAMYEPVDTARLKGNIDTRLGKETLHERQNRSILDVAAQVRKDLKKGDLSPENLKQTRTWVKENLVTGNRTDQERRIGRDMLKEIEDFRSTTPVTTPTGPSLAVNKELKEADELYAKGKRVQRVGEAEAKAKSRAETTGSALVSGNLENTRRQEFKKLLDKSNEGKLPSAYNAPESELLGEVKGGTFGRDLGRLGGAVSPLRGGIMSAIQGIGALPAYLAGGPWALAGQAGLAAGAEGAAYAGRKATERSIDDLKQMILTGVDPRGDPATVNAMRDLWARTAAGGVRGGRQGR